MEATYSSTNSQGGGATVLVPEEQSFHLQGYCYRDRGVLLPELATALTDCGGWILDRQILSPAAIEYRFEIQLAGVDELYGSMVQLGLELVRSTHGVLTDLCTCRQHITRSIDPCKILTMQLEIRFLTDMTLQSLLMTGVNQA